jgi:predicted transcriptional regulator
MTRRAQGALESDVLATLWAADEPQTPDQVRVALGADLAYTTVATILVRLAEKGLVTREQHGRGYRYAPVAVDAAGVTALRMQQVLAGDADRGRVLARFVATLSKRDEAALRRALGRPGR